MRKTYVTRPALPALEDYQKIVSSIWESKQLTNGGPVLRQFEDELRDKLQVGNLSVFCNATVALLTVMKGLQLSGEVITTPFTFAATATAIDFLGLQPVFVDIDPDTLCLSPQKIEENHRSNQCYPSGSRLHGIPCDCQGIARIAARHDLKVIYDGAHTFGAINSSLYNYGSATC